MNERDIREAVLKSAAPDLLEAAKMALRALVRDRESGDSGNYEEQPEELALKAAIAKATVSPAIDMSFIEFRGDDGRPLEIRWERSPYDENIYIAIHKHFTVTVDIEAFHNLNENPR